LSKELQAQNKAPATTLAEKKKTVAPKAKKPAIAMSKVKEPSVPKKSKKQASEKAVEVALPEEVVMSKSRRGRQIVLPQRFK